MLEVEKVKTESALHSQKLKVMELKNDEFQDEVYKTVQNLSKEMNDAFTMLSKTGNKNLLEPLDQNKFSEKSEQVEQINRVTDQNIRNVFNALEKHKLLLEDRFNRHDITQERIKAQVHQMEQDFNIK